MKMAAPFSTQDNTAMMDKPPTDAMVFRSTDEDVGDFAVLPMFCDEVLPARLMVYGVGGGLIDEVLCQITVDKGTITEIVLNDG